MLLPPNLLLWEEEVPDFQLCIQIATSSAGARLFSSSITEHDLDNFLCHSCAPNTNVVIGKDLAAGLVAKYPLTPGDAITFDYDQTEDDLRDLREKGGVDRGGAEMCRGEILGRLFSPPLGAKKAAAAAACAAA